jgi:hypothetical protein
MESNSDIHITLLHEEGKSKESRCEKLSENFGCQCFLNLLVVLIIAGILAGIIYAIMEK